MTTGFKVSGAVWPYKNHIINDTAIGGTKKKVH